MEKLPNEIINKILDMRNDIINYENYKKLYDSKLKYVHMQIKYYMIKCNNIFISKFILDKIKGKVKLINIIAEEMYLYHNNYSYI